MQHLSKQHIIAIKSHVSKCMHHKRNPCIVTINNTPYVIKKQRRESGRVWREYSSSLACLLLFKQPVKPRKLRAGGIHHEAQRIRELHKLGLNVPNIIKEGSNYIVMEHCGESLEHVLSKTPNNKSLLQGITEELITLHKKGQWHGGAQVRNLTIKNSVIYRIDFEENTGNALPLHLAQAYDILLCFSSLTPYWINKGTLSTELMTHYLQTLNNYKINKTLFRLSKHLKRTKNMMRPFLRKPKTKKDIQHALYFSKILDQSLKNTIN